MTGFRVSNEIALPLDFVTEKCGVLARTGAGKSYTASVLAEELLKAQQQVAIIDLTGAWWGLRSSADGARAGLPIYIFGGDHGDIPLEPTAGKMVADLVAGDQISVVLDLSNFESRGQETKFVTDFAEQLYRKNRKALHLFIDEADSFAPQRPMPDERRMLGAMELVFRRGRIRGIGGSLISQRSAVVNKNVLSQAGILIVLQTSAPQDRDAIEAWAEGKGTREQVEELIGSLASLPIGTAWIWWPARSIFEKVRIRRRETFDSGRTPKAGEVPQEPKRLAEVDLEQLRKQMAATVEKAKQEDPKELRRQIAELKKQLAERSAPAAAAPKVVEKRVEVSVLKDGHCLRLEQISKGLLKAVSEIATIVSKSGAVFSKNGPFVSRPPVTVSKSQPAPLPVHAEVPGEGKPLILRSGERRMLQVLAQRKGERTTKSNLGTLSGFSVSGGTFNTYLNTLIRHGFAQTEGDSISATWQGINLLGGDVPPAPASTDELVAMWRRALRAGEARMLDELVKEYPRAIVKAELGDRTGFTVSGGTFNTYLNTLRRNGLADVDGDQVKANESLFLNGARV